MRAVGEALDADLSGDPARCAATVAPRLRGYPCLPPRQVLLRINDQVNYDLPLALLGGISDADFADSVLLDRRRRDHERLHGVLSGRVAAEDDGLSSLSTKSGLDRVLTPLNRAAFTRFLRGPAPRCGTTRRS
ncbi:MAG: DUF5995 family protein [Terracoccus sp.]